MKILIIRAGALGDTLMLMPSIKALTKNHQITILGRKPGIYYLEPYVDQCIDIERGGWHGLFSRETDIDIPCPQVDDVIAFINDKESIVFENLNKLFFGSNINIFPPFPENDSQTHVALHMACAIQTTGIPFNPLAAFDAALTKPMMKPSGGSGKKIVLHPGSGSKKKNYSPDFWFDLLEKIKIEIPDSSMEICFLLGPAEEDIVSVIEKTAEELNARIYSGSEKEELLSILKSSYLYIGHDSGVTHLAAMLGINTIVLFKNSSIEQWHPLGPSVKIVEADEDEVNILDVAKSEAVTFLKRRPVI